MDTLIVRKLVAVRDYLGMSQSQIAGTLNVSQALLSKLEVNGKVTIPNAYLAFLGKNGINLNLIFDANVDVEEMLARLNGEAYQPADVHPAVVPDCTMCAEKNKQIDLLVRWIEDKDATIRDLRGQRGLDNSTITKAG